jgi:hypothetical protein
VGLRLSDPPRDLALREALLDSQIEEPALGDLESAARELEHVSFLDELVSRLLNSGDRLRLVVALVIQEAARYAAAAR